MIASPRRSLVFSIVFSISFIVIFVAIAKSAFADYTIGSGVTKTNASRLTITTDPFDDELTVSAGGTIIVNNNDAVFSDSAFADDGIVPVVTVDSQDNSKGIIASGASNAAIKFSGEDIYYASINATSGLITSANEDGTIEISNIGNGDYKGFSRNITVGEEMTISNSEGAGSSTINISDSNLTGTLSNSGTIVNSNTDATTSVIKFDNVYCFNINDCENDYTITNTATGLIDAGEGAKAILVNNEGDNVGGLTINNANGGEIDGDIQFSGRNVNTINNSGTITGSISNVEDATNSIAGDTTLINDEDGEITGDISTSSGLMAITNEGVITGDINLGSDSSSALNMNGGQITGDITMTQGQKINIASGGITGSVTGSGTLDFGDTNRTTSGDTIITSGSVIDIGSASHTHNGSINILDGGILALDITSLTSAGSINATTGGGASLIADGANLKITFGSSTAIYGTKNYTIVTTNAGDVSAIQDADIDINSSGSNRVGLVTYTTSVSNDNLILTAQSDSASSVTSDKSQQNIYNALSSNDSNDSGNQLSIKNYIFNNGSISSQQRTNAIDSIRPNDTGLNQSAFSISSFGAMPSLKRVSQIRSARLEEEGRYKIVDKNGNELEKSNGLVYAKKQSKKKYDAFSYFQENKISAWAQIYSSKAEQKNKTGFFGYEAKTNGFSIGFDTQYDKDSVIGTSISYSFSDIDGKTNSQNTDIASYQLNIYLSKNLNNKIYIDGLAGVVLNSYSSSRSISAVNAVANSKFNGETYLAKIKSGKIYQHDKYQISPELALNFAHNAIDDYQESGAGNLNLNVQSDDSQFLEGEVAIKLAYNKFEYGEYDLIPRVKLAYGYDFIGNEQVSRSNFIGQNVVFETQSSKVNKSAIKTDFELEIFDQENLTFNINYILEKRGDYQIQTGLLKFKYDF